MQTEERWWELHWIERNSIALTSKGDGDLFVKFGHFALGCCFPNVENNSRGKNGLQNTLRYDQNIDLCLEVSTKL